jgi:hypothetical protein
MVNAAPRLSNPTPAKVQKKRRSGIGTVIAKRETRRQKMKKGLITIVCLIALSVTAIPAGAQTRQRRYDQRYDQRVYSGQRYNRDWYDNRSVWDKHRDKITTAGGAGAGALLGGLFGGTKGAIIGAIAGGGGAALYTYKLRDRNRDYRNRRY